MSEEIEYKKDLSKYTELLRLRKCSDENFYCRLRLLEEIIDDEYCNWSIKQFESYSRENNG